MPWSTRPQAPVGIPQRRKHRHHHDGYRTGADRTVAKPLRFDRVGAVWRLLHVWNHALFEAVLFLGAGSVIHATHTSEIDHLGGLAKSMPSTAGLFLIGAVAICGLPPLNGFVSEFFLYLGFISTVLETSKPAYSGIAFAAPMLALIGALAVACFVKAFATIFWGRPIDAFGPGTRIDVRDAGPMAVLAACCLTIGLAPQGLPLVLDRGVNAWAPEISERLPRLAEVAPLSSIGAIAVAIMVAILVGCIATAHSAANHRCDGNDDLGLRTSSHLRACNIPLRLSLKCSWDYLLRFSCRSPVGRASAQSFLHQLGIRVRCLMWCWIAACCRRFGSWLG